MVMKYFNTIRIHRIRLLENISIFSIDWYFLPIMSLFFVGLERKKFFDKAYYSVPQRKRSLMTRSFVITLNTPVPISNMLLVHHSSIRRWYGTWYQDWKMGSCLLKVSIWCSCTNSKDSSQVVLTRTSHALGGMTPDKVGLIYKQFLVHIMTFHL